MTRALVAFLTHGAVFAAGYILCALFRRNEPSDAEVMARVHQVHGYRHD